MSDHYCPFHDGNAGTACPDCGYVLKRTFPTPPIRRCGPRLLGAETCPHIGPARVFRSGPEAGQPVTVEVTCDTCGGKRKQVAQPVFSCALFGRCLPTYRPSPELRQQYESRDDAIRLCDGCSRGAE